MSSRFSFFSRSLSLLAATAALALTTGCATGIISTSHDELAGNAVFSGTVYGGVTPINGATVTAYATGTSGYGSGATSLGSGTTTAGGFTITRNANTCADPQQIYLVSSGGDTGAGVNTDSVLVAALGKCSSVTSGTTGLKINELTTVAAAEALQGFADTGVNIGTTSTNPLGLTNAFLNVANLVNLDGSIKATTVGGNGTVPTSVLYTLADILEACVNTAGGSGGNCATIFVGGPAGTGAAAPTNTWQEALDMARYPGYKVSTLFGVIAGSGTSYAALPNAPADLSVGILYTTGSGFPWDIKADAGGNIWISGQTGVGLTELSSNGSVLTASAGSTALKSASTRGLAIDNASTPSVWVADTSGNVYKFTPSTSTTTAVALPTSITVGGTATAVVNTPTPLAVDAANNVWYTTYGAASATQTFGEIPAGTTTATTTFANSPLLPESTKGAYFMNINAQAATNSIWAGSQSTSKLYTATDGVTPGAAGTVATTTNPVNAIAFDASNNTWAIGQPSGANKGIIYKVDTSNTVTAITGPTSPAATVGLYGPRGLAIDGSGRLFVTSFTTTAAVVEFDPAIYAAGTGSTTPSGYLVNAAGNGFNPINSSASTTITVSSPRNITIDQSGALWVSNGSSSTTGPAVQILGIAAPTNPVLAAGAYGTKP